MQIDNFRIRNRKPAFEKADKIILGRAFRKKDNSRIYSLTLKNQRLVLKTTEDLLTIKHSKWPKTTSQKR